KEPRAARAYRLRHHSMTPPPTQPCRRASRVTDCIARGRQETESASHSWLKGAPVRAAARVAKPERSATPRRGSAKPKPTQGHATRRSTLARPTLPAMWKRGGAPWWAAPMAGVATEMRIASVATATPRRCVRSRSARASVRASTSSNAEHGLTSHDCSTQPVLPAASVSNTSPILDSTIRVHFLSPHGARTFGARESARSPLRARAGSALLVPLPQSAATFGCRRAAGSGTTRA
ncbi:MAG: hypothetical protein K0R38_7517, partial [Polyangiaceae bacterium]|nr:hypothetical protein [Polyangiaceae bacterium]